MKKKMNTFAKYSMLTAVLLAAFVVNAQERRTSANYNFHGDVADIGMREPGQLEGAFTPEEMKRVRALHIDGPINGDDIKFLRKILTRSSAEDNNGRSVSNYVDLDLRRARIVGGGAAYYSYYRTEHDVVGKSMFQSCNHLRSIELPERARCIDDDAFRYCSSLEEVVVPWSVRALGKHAFAGCNSLTRINLNDDIEVLPEGCFEDCGSLRNLQLPPTLREIGNRALKGVKVTLLPLPRSLSRMGKDALDKVPLTVFNIPAGMVIDDNDPGHLPMLEEVNVEQGSRSYSCEDGVLYDAGGEVLLLFPARKQGAFSVPQGVRRIEASAFGSCNMLTAVDMASSVQEVGNGAFRDCQALQRVVFAAGVTSLGTSVLENCKRLQACSLPVELKILPPGTFKGCESLRSVDLPACLEVIGEAAFKEAGLRNVVLPVTLKTIEKEAFRSCKSLEGVRFGKGLLTIGKEAFRDCSSLTQVLLPQVLQIDKEAFRGCKALLRIELPQTVSTIGDNAFRETAITCLEIPAGVVKMGDKIAEKCKSLQHIVCHAVAPPELGKVSDNKRQLRVPAASVEAYKKAKHWKEFKNILPLE